MALPPWIQIVGSILLKWLLGLIGKKPDPNAAERKEIVRKELPKEVTKGYGKKGHLKRLDNMFKRLKKVRKK